jgi:hypothetical protein
MDRSTARDLCAEAALLRKYSAELRAYSDEVRKRVKLILESAHASASPNHGRQRDPGARAR